MGIENHFKNIPEGSSGMAIESMERWAELAGKDFLGVHILAGKVRKSDLFPYATRSSGSVKTIEPTPI